MKIIKTITGGYGITKHVYLIKTRHIYRYDGAISKCWWYKYELKLFKIYMRKYYDYFNSKLNLYAEFCDGDMIDNLNIITQEFFIQNGLRFLTQTPESGVKI